jgi:hypothetical protein
MTTQTQKQEERRHFYEFKALYADFPEGDICDKREEPDFLIKADKITIGIEHTRFFREQKLGKRTGGSPLRGEDDNYAKLVQSVQSKFESKHAIPVVVSFLPYWGNLVKKADMKNLTREALALIEVAIPQVSKYTTIGSEELADTSLEEYLASITMARPAGATTSNWHFMGRGVPILAKGELQTIILGKEQRVNDYLNNCDEVWLLIVADGEHSSSMIDYSTDNITRMTRWSFQTGFAKVLLYDRLRQRVIPFLVTHRVT